MSNRYALRFLNRQTEIETTVLPDEFLDIAKQFHELFALPRYEGYQVWRDNGGTWEALYGIKQSMFTLLADLVEEAEPTVDNSEEVGRAIIDNYRAWRDEVSDIEKNGARRSLEGDLLHNLKTRISTVHMALRDLKADLKDVNVFEIFTLLTDDRKTSSTQKERALNVSRATYYRQQSLFLKLLGLWVMNRIRDEQFDQLIVPYKNHPEIGTNLPPVTSTM